jgi:hypothetical protein
MKATGGGIFSPVENLGKNGKKGKPEGKEYHYQNGYLEGEALHV